MAQIVRNLPEMQETWVQSLGLEDAREKVWQSNPVFSPGEFHGQRSLVGYSSWGHKESHMTERLTYIYMYVFTGIYYYFKRDTVYVVDTLIS